MANQGEHLYNWDKFSKPRVYSRSQRVTTNNDIQDWIKTVEDASATAAAKAFGTPVPTSRSNMHVKKKVAATVADMHIHEAAYSEAQDLLNQWVNEKVELGPDDEEESDKIWTKKTAIDIKKEWDHLVDIDDDEDSDKYIEDSTNHFAPTDDIYSALHADEDKTVESIIQKMMQKDMVKDSVKKDLGLDGPYNKKLDPRTKMQLRHQQVKENHEKRIKEKERRMQEFQSKKEVELEARQMLKKEELTKKLIKKKEEGCLQKEMANIRRQMEEERKHKEEERLRQKKKQDELAQKAKEEFEKQQKEERLHNMKTRVLTEERNRQIMKRMEEIEIRETAQNLKCLQSHFSVWYNVVIERRIQLGKARATADWKLMLKVFNGWKSFARSKVSERTSNIHEENVKSMHRKELMGKEFYRHSLLRKCFTAWQLFNDQQQGNHITEERQHSTRSKMAAFLNAAATGKLWQQDPQPNLEKSASMSDIGNESARISNKQRVNELFAEAPRANLGNLSDRSSIATTRSEYLARVRQEKESKRLKRPNEPWQITKKHINLSKKKHVHGDSNSANLLDTPGSTTSTERSDNSDIHDTSQRPWEKAPFPVDNYANRHLAQQKILSMQQKQIKDQQRLIVELTYLQKQQMLQQQVLQDQTKQLTSAAPQMPNDKSKALQNHINSLQNELLKKNQEIDLFEKTAEGTNGQLKLDIQGSASARSNISAVSGASQVSNTSNVSRGTTDSRHLSFLKSMDERATERARQKQEREGRKQKIEEEKLAALLEEGEAIKLQQEEEKRLKADAYREKKRLEKQKEQDKIHQAERFKQLNQIADDHYKKSVMKNRGLRPFCKLVEMTRNYHKTADKHFKNTLLQKCLLAWHTRTETEIKDKNNMANEFYNYILIRRCFKNWKRYGEAVIIQEKKATTHYESGLKLKVFQAWADHAATEKIAMWHKERVAREHNTWRIQMTALRVWIRYPKVCREEEERERRRIDMRKKVASMLTDYSVDKSINKSTDFL